MKIIFNLLFSTVSLVCLLMPHHGVSQLNPLGAMYFRNQYLANPAMAATEDGVRVNLGFQQQWNSIAGAPTTKYITGEYSFSNKVGIGLNVLMEEAGLLKTTRVKATYAYHLPISTNDRLHFGLSLGIGNERIDPARISGDADDPLVARFNDRGAFFDGDFGAAYTNGKLTVQAAFPNMISFFSREETSAPGRATFFAAASYKIMLREGAGAVSLEPKAGVRGVNGYDAIVDAGGNLTFLGDQLNIFALYHSSKNATVGVGVKVMDLLTITGMYASETAALKSYTKGNFEVGLLIPLGVKRSSPSGSQP